MNTNMQALNWAIHAAIDSPIAWRILVCMANRVNTERGDFEVWPSHRQIAEDARTSVPSVKRYLAELIEDRFVESRPGQRSDGGKSANRYVLLVGPPPIAQPDPGVRAVSHGIAQPDLSPQLTADLCNEPLKEEPSKDEQPPTEESHARETDLFGEQIESDEQRQAREQAERKAADDRVVEFVQSAWTLLKQHHPRITGIREIDDRRRERLLARSSEVRVWQEIVDEVRQSPFLRGEADPAKGQSNPFTLRFDWALEPGNFLKILEGSYRDKRIGHDGFDASGRKKSAHERARDRIVGELERSRQRRGPAGHPSADRPAALLDHSSRTS